MLNRKVKKYLDSLKIDLKYIESDFSMHRVAQKIIDLIEEDKDSRQLSENKAEEFAFYLEEGNPNTYIGWDTYYGPMRFSTDKMTIEGRQFDEYPSIREINRSTVEYWAKRAKESEATSTILTARYADLVVDFSLKILGEDADNNFYHKVIDSNIIICKENLAVPSVSVTKAKRALDLAIRIKDKKRANNVKDTVIELERNTEKYANTGLLGVAFKWLLLEYSEKITLSNKERLELVVAAEHRLKTVTGSISALENAALPLIRYYERRNDEDKLMHVLNVSEDFLKEHIHSNSSMLDKLTTYDCIYRLYSNYESRFKKAKEESNRIKKERKQLNLDYDKHWDVTFTGVNIKKKNIDYHVNRIFDDGRELQMILRKIALEHLLDKENISYSYSPNYLSPDIIGEIQPTRDEYENLYPLNALQRLPYLESNSFVLLKTVNELRVRFSEIEIIKYFSRSVVFKNENKDYLKKAICAYWHKDYLISSHLFSPMVESAMRELVMICGGRVSKRCEKNIYASLSLNKLLEHPYLKKFYSRNNEKILTYFKLVLIDKYPGMNLRNDFAHGLRKKRFSLHAASDRLFHILILLSLVKQEEIKQSHFCNLL